MSTDRPPTPPLDLEAIGFASSTDEVLALVAEVKGLRADLAACREALAPLLWEPRRTMYASGAPPALVCVFCAVDAPGHAPDCPVLRRAALLGAGGEEGA